MVEKMEIEILMNFNYISMSQIVGLKKITKRK